MSLNWVTWLGVPKPGQRCAARTLYCVLQNFILFLWLGHLVCFQFPPWQHNCWNWCRTSDHWLSKGLILAFSAHKTASLVPQNVDGSAAFSLSMIVSCFHMVIFYFVSSFVQVIVFALFHMSVCFTSFWAILNTKFSTLLLDGLFFSCPTIYTNKVPFATFYFPLWSLAHLEFWQF